MARSDRYLNRLWRRATASPARQSSDRIKRKPTIESLEPRLVASGDTPNLSTSALVGAAAPSALISSTQSTSALSTAYSTAAVNTYDLDAALNAGLAHLAGILDAGNNNEPFFTAWALTLSQAKALGDAGTGQGATATFGADRHFVSNVSGRALYALLLGSQQLGTTIPTSVYNSLKSFVLKSLHKPRNGNWSDPNPANQMVTGLAADPATFGSLQFDVTYLFNMGAGLRGSMALAALGQDQFATIPGYTWSARHVYEQSVDNIRRYYVYNKTLGGPRVYNWEQFRYQLGLRGGDAYTGSLSTELKSSWTNLWKNWADPFLVHDLVKYYEATGHQPSLELAKELRDLGFSQRFPTDPNAVPLSSFTHMYEAVAEMNAYSRLALVLGDADMMNRVRVRYEVLRDRVFGSTGWTPEWWGKNSDVGEVNNTTELIETALNFAQFGWTQYYDDVERFTRGYLLPSQLLDTGFVTPNAQPKTDAERDIPNRLFGAFGFAAPYGHVATNKPYYTGGYFTDITAGAVATLAEIKKAGYAYRGGRHEVNLLFDVDNSQITVASPYPNSGELGITTKIAGDVRVHLPSWVDRTALATSLAQQGLSYELSSDAVLIRNPTVGATILLAMPLAVRREIDTVNGRQITIDWRGDSVVAMSRMGTAMPFFAEPPTVPPSPPSNPGPAPIPAPSAEAVNLIATSDAAGRISISWQRGTLTPAAFVVTIAEGATATAGSSSIDVGLNTSHVAAGLKANTVYAVRVSARDAQGQLSAGVLKAVTTAAAEAVNTYNLDRALEAAVAHLANIEDPNNGGQPYFNIWALTQAQAQLYGDASANRVATASMEYERHFVSNVAGRALYAMLLGSQTLGAQTPTAAFNALKTLVLKSLHKPRNGNWNDPNPANQMVTGLAADPRFYGSQQFDFNFLFNMGAGMWGALGLAAIAPGGNDVIPGYTWSARHVFEQSVDNFRRYYVYNKTLGGTRVYDWEQFRYQLGLTGGNAITGNLATETQSSWSGIWKTWADPFLVYSLVKYYESSGHQPTLELAKELRDLSFYRRFPTTAAGVPWSSFTHMHEVVGEMAAYSRLALVLGDADMMNRVRVRYEALRDKGFFATGWVAETYGRNSDVGEINNTGFLIETAINFAQFGWTQYYEDAERFTRAQLLPAQLLDTSFVTQVANPTKDGQKNVRERMRGAFGFAAPYGHVATKNPYYTGGYFADITAGAVASLAEAKKAAYALRNGAHEINLLFDVNNDKITVASPYPNGDKLVITPKVAGDVRVRLPSWADRSAATASLASQGLTYTIEGDYVRITGAMVNRAIQIAMPLAARTQNAVLNNRAITIRWRGDSVAAMSGMGTPMPFFPSA